MHVCRQTVSTVHVLVVIILHTASAQAFGTIVIGPLQLCSTGRAVSDSYLQHYEILKGH
jgi:hypothetical protein